MKPGQLKLGDLAGIAEAQAAIAEAHRKSSIEELLNGDSEEPISIFAARSKLPSLEDMFSCGSWWATKLVIYHVSQA